MLATRLAVLVVTLASLWSLCFVVLGNTPGGKQWYGNLASVFFADAKAGVLVLTLCIPVLLSGSLAALCTLRPVSKPSTPQRGPQPTLSSQFPIWVHRMMQRWNSGSGDVNFNQFALLFVFIPLSIYIAANIHRHLYGKELSLDDQLMEIGNSFGMAALVALAYLLIPVARHSALLKLLNWSPATAIRLHIWSGRIVFVSVFVHGGMHMVRFKYLAGESLIKMLIPPRRCWTLQDSDFEPVCVSDDTDCSCYYLFRNLTGFMSLVGFAVIGITSVNYIRRYHYRLFYMAHVLAAPMALMFAILHWNKAIVYMAPSLLYYAASSVPIMIETRQKVKRKQGVKIISIQHIEPSHHGGRQRSCIALTFQASAVAMKQFNAGQYVKLLAPDIAINYHPFTVTHVPDKENQLRVIFRATGNFTYTLADRLVRGVGGLPILHVDGFHGPCDRVAQVLKHDVATFVAGGIGITPYLTLLSEVKAALACRTGVLTEVAIPEVVLHWVCRDVHLIQYVRSEYFESLLRNAGSSTSLRLRLVVHNTSPESAGRAYLDSPETTPESDRNGVIVNDEPVGAPFMPTSFSPGSEDTLKGNIAGFVVFSTSAWFGLVLVWYLYNKVVDKYHVASRAWGAIAVVVVAVLVGVVANVCVSHRNMHLGGMLLEGSWWTRVGRESDCGDNTIEMEDIEEGAGGLPLVEDKDGILDDEAIVHPASYDERQGRPSVHELLKEVHDARCPGLFACGPSGMIDELKRAAEEHCLNRIRQCISGTPHIAIYDETFEM